MYSQCLAQIEEYEKEILKKNPPKELKRCPKCKQNPEKFRLHSCRERIFFVILESLVKEVKSFLGRFVCGLCKGSFTHYPAYALPYKRYLLPQIQEKSQEYVQESGKTYEQVASYEKGPILHEKREQNSQVSPQKSDSGPDQKESPKADNQPPQEKEFSKSSVWRWICFLGKQEENLTKMLSLIGQKDPQTKLFRKVYPIDPRKYKTECRKNLLITAARILDAIKEFKEVFGEFFKFTDFATGF